MKRFPIYLTLIFTFLLGTHEGFVALWRDGAPIPAQVFPYRTESLPLSDQQALEKGIRVRSEVELSQLLEDLLS